MNPALYQHWKRQQAERLRRDHLRAARQPPVAAVDPLAEPAVAAPPAKPRTRSR